MASSSFKDAPSPDEANPDKAVTIVIGEDGDLNYDEKTLQSIIDSNQQTAAVNFVRVSGTEDGGVSADTTTSSADPGEADSNAILMLDEEQIHRIESLITTSEEGKDLLDNVANSNPSEAALVGDLLAMRSDNNQHEVDPALGPPPPLIPNTEVKQQVLQQNQEASKKGTKKPPQRKSQRQMERELKEEADRIRQENLENEKKEKEAMRRQSMEESQQQQKTEQGFDEEPEVGEAAATGKKSGGPAASRPKRQRKLPAHLKGEDFEYSYKGLPGEEKKKAGQPASTPDQVEDEVVPAAVADEDDDNATSDEEVEDADDSADFESDEDPEKLWCICQQPHNNRFMICCDKCLDWFHGKCVGITKKMGKEMEEAKNEWICPKCKTSKEGVTEEPIKAEIVESEEKKKAAAKRKKLPLKKSHSKDSADSSGEKKKPEPKMPKCFVCEKPPIHKTLYCSDDCISKHAKHAIEILGKNKSRTPDSKKKTTMMTAKTQILVMEPGTTQMINGPSAPTESNLESWLKTHPTFHAVLPKTDHKSKFYGHKSSKLTGSSIHRDHIGSNAAKVKAALLKSNNKDKIVKAGDASKKDLSDTKLSVASPTKPTPTGIGGATSKKVITAYLDQPSSSDSSSSKKRHSSDYDRKRKHSESPKTPIVVHRSRKDSESTPKRKEFRRSDSVTTPPSTSVDPKPIRKNCEKGLTEALKIKAGQNPEFELTEDQIKELAKLIEEEMFELYNHDVSTKYKVKYRSLVFNIKDQKNVGLFKKIATKNLTPKALVNMTAEEMASKELKEWRQHELKHDIEKIKSHELELLQVGSKHILKSHKGEQVIDDGTTKSNVETITKLPEDIQAEKKKKSSSSDSSGSKISSKTWEHDNHKFDKDCQVCAGKMTEDEFLEAKIEREKRRKERRHHSSSKSSSHHRSHHSSSSRHHKDDKDRRSSSRSSNNSSKHGHKDSSGKDHDKDKERRHRHHSKDKDRDRDRDRHRRRSGGSHKTDKDRHHHSSSSKSSSSHSKDKNLSKSQSPKEATTSDEPKVKPEDVEKKVNEILASAGAIDIAKAREEQMKAEQADNSVEEINEPVDIDVRDFKPISSTTIAEASEVTSTVTIKTPEDVTTADSSGNPVVWKGDINMPDVARFCVNARQVSGTTDYLTVDLKETLKIVGRIPPKTVWDYVKQIAETKEILLISLHPNSKDEKAGYDNFFTYLKKRDRLGVVGDLGKLVKDCYIMALSSEEPIPSSLLPLDGPGLDENKTDLLLAIIVRGRRKRSTDTKYVAASGLAGQKRPHPASSQQEKSRTTPPEVLLTDHHHAKQQKTTPTYIPAPVGSLDSQPYDPAAAGSMPTTSTATTSSESPSTSPGDSEIYDPESAFPDESHQKQHGHHEHDHHKHIKIRVEFDSAGYKKEKRAREAAAAAAAASASKVDDNLSDFSDEDFDDDSPSPPPAKKFAKDPGPITSTGGGFTDQLAKLTQEIEQHKKDIATIGGKTSSASNEDYIPGLSDDPGLPSYKGLPSTITSILFGGGPSSGSTSAGKHDNRDPRKKPSAPAASTASTLGKMSDADLIAKAALEMGDPPMGVSNQGQGTPMGSGGHAFMPPPDPAFNMPPPQNRNTY